VATPALKHILEAALLAAGGPLTLEHMQGLFEPDAVPEKAAMRAALAELDADYAERGIELREVAGGYRVQVRAALAPWVARLWEERPQRYSRALLETLAIIAYRQPVTRGDIEAIRGVSVNTQIMRTLQDRGWVRTLGQKDVPGRPTLYGTTPAFLDHFNLSSLDDLPTLEDLRDLDQEHPELDLRFPGEGSGPPASADKPQEDDSNG